jgi:hypothetical protein
MITCMFKSGPTDLIQELSKASRRGTPTIQHAICDMGLRPNDRQKGSINNRDKLRGDCLVSDTDEFAAEVSSL